MSLETGRRRFKSVMDIIKDIRNKAKALQKVIVFPESGDPRVLRAVEFLSREKLCRSLLIGCQDKIQRVAAKERIELDIDSEATILVCHPDREEIVKGLYERCGNRGIPVRESRQLFSANPLIFGAALVDKGYADGIVAGSVGTTGDVVKAAIRCIGTKKEASVVSGIFLLIMPDGKVFTYGDCGVIPYPDATQLADIAIQSSRSHKQLTGRESVTALLSFSTKGSANHERVELVKEALRIAKRKAPDLMIDGELQFDAALLPEVAKRKAPRSQVAGRANVFIFPNLDTGNIAYKITERLAGATAIGPILQGLAKPVMDLSRGCSWKDIVNAACIAALMVDSGNTVKEKEIRPIT